MVILSREANDKHEHPRKTQCLYKPRKDRVAKKDMEKEISKAEVINSELIILW